MIAIPSGLSPTEIGVPTQGGDAHAAVATTVIGVTWLLPLPATRTVCPFGVIAIASGLWPVPSVMVDVVGGLAARLICVTVLELAFATYAVCPFGATTTGSGPLPTVILGPATPVAVLIGVTVVPVPPLVTSAV